MYKTTILFLLFFSCSLCISAQGLSVDRFVELNESTASLPGTSMKDQNGHNAALIKIVTPETGFSFEGGSMGIVGTKQHTGEIWVYVPGQAEKLTIKHKDFGVLRDYYYSVGSLEGGHTYEMLLNIGTGRYVTVTSSVAHSDITIDGEYAGKAPLYNRYLNYGKHTVSAVNGRYEGVSEVFITVNDTLQKGRVIAVDMKDMSDHYGDVNVSVAGRADIYFNGRYVGTGTWRDQLREGSYEVETRKADCDPVKTQFTVTARQQNNVEAYPPKPHMGWLQLYTRPRNAVVTYNGTSPLDVTEVQTLPVGTCQLEVAKKGYVSQKLDYTIRRGETVCDTVQLERITYVKPTAFYFGAAFTVRNLSGISGILGAVIKNNDIQVSYTHGLIKSKNGPLYDTTDPDNWILQGVMSYKISSFAVKYGYQIPLVSRLALVPQAGYSLNFLSAKLESGSLKTGNGAMSHSISVGLKLLFVPVHHCYIFVAPEYDFAVSKDEAFKAASGRSDFSANTFAVNAGILVNF